MNNTVLKIYNWALDEFRYVNKKYDSCYDYKLHIDLCLKYAFKYKYIIDKMIEEKIVPDNFFECIVVAICLHDTDEDCHSQTYNSIKQLLKAMYKEDKKTVHIIMELVFSVTQYRGRNRAERYPPQYYYDIKALPGATFVKLCDRLSNLTFGALFSDLKKEMLGEKESMFDTYKLEQVGVKEKIYEERYKDMFDNIDRILEFKL